MIFKKMTYGLTHVTDLRPRAGTAGGPRTFACHAITDSVSL
eukprot:COSAG02_NODE_469_length_21727_cov_64.506334_18_plen_41_part_00